MKTLLGALIVAAGLLSVRADLIDFSCVLDGTTAGTVSPAKGKALFAQYDTATDILTLIVGYGYPQGGGPNLIGDYLVSHIHREAGGVFAGLVNSPLPPGSTKSGIVSGSISYAGKPVEKDELFRNVQYVNIHTTFAPGGEIKGFLIVPEPSAVTLALALGLPALLLCRRKK